MLRFAEPASERRLSIRLAAVVAGLSFVAGVAVAGFTDGDSAETAAPHPEPVGDGTAQASAPGPRTFVDGIPSGFARTEVGAIAAAAAFVTTGQALLDLDPLAADEALRRMAAAESADRFVSQTMDQLRAAREALAEGSGPIVFRQGVVAHRVDAFSAARARVAVWNVGVLTRAGVAPPQAGWAISTFDLVWERGDWRIWSETVIPGPAPILNDSTAPATTVQFLSALDGFVDFGSRR